MDCAVSQWLGERVVDPAMLVEQGQPVEARRTDGHVEVVARPGAVLDAQLGRFRKRMLEQRLQRFGRHRAIVATGRRMAAVRTEEAVRRWIEAWERGWPARDVDAIAGRYRDDAPYRSHPFREVDTARSYLERAFGEEDLVEARFGEPVVAGERAAVEYWAVLRSPTEGDVTIAGASFLRFADDGRVVDHRDYWTQTEGARAPSSGWGR